VLKRWDKRNYEIGFVLKVFDLMDIPKPKVHVG